MTIIQTTARVPEEYRDLILRVSARIREDVEFPAKLEALLLETMGTPVAYQLPPDVADTLAALDARVKAIEAHFALAEPQKVAQLKEAFRAGLRLDKPDAAPAEKPAPAARGRAIKGEEAPAGNRKKPSPTS